MEVIDVVRLVRLGTPGSFYLLVPAKLKERLGLNETDEFILQIDDGNIIYKRKEVPS